MNCAIVNMVISASSSELSLENEFLESQGVLRLFAACAVTKTRVF